MPDIDIDFCFERRDEIIDYVLEKYGKDSVCQIITYGTMLARGVLRDVGRALGLSYGETDRIAKLVPERLGITLEEALDEVEELRDVREEDPRYDRLIHHRAPSSRACIVTRPSTLPASSSRRVT